MAVLLASGLNSKASDPGEDDHCKAGGSHGSYCEWVTSIAVEFTSTTIPPRAWHKDKRTGEQVEWIRSGRIFHGTLTYTIEYCIIDDCGNSTTRSKEISAPVHTGGYTENLNISDPADSCCPPGENYTTNAHKTGGNAKGFSINVNASTGRDGIEIHNPGVSTGCIVFDGPNDGVANGNENWTTFCNYLEKGNDGKQSCPHSPPQEIPTSVTYSDEIDPPPHGYEAPWEANWPQ